MPIYEYQCQSCDYEFEKLQRISDDPLQECPQCHQLSLKKKISAAGFRLSGGGWYETDFKSGNKKNLAGDGGNSSTKTETSGDKKADSTPAKVDSKPAAASKAKE